MQTPLQQQKKKGLDMFETLKKEKETNFHLDLMENRIKKLEDEQERAQRKIQETLERTQRYQRIQDQKNQHKKVLEDQRNSLERAQEEYRQKILQEKQERERRMNELNERRLQEKRDTKYHIDHSISTMKQRSNIEHEQDYSGKQDQYDQIKSTNVQGRQMRKDLRTIMELERTENYIKKQADTFQNIQIKKDKIAQLAQKELELMHKLQTTIKAQENVVNQLQDKTGLNKKILFSRLPTDITFCSTNPKFYSQSTQNSPRNNSELGGVGGNQSRLIYDIQE
eukprot:403354615